MFKQPRLLLAPVVAVALTLALCSVAQAGAPVDVPLLTAKTPSFESNRVVWLDRGPDCFGSRAGSLAQARGPPALT